MLDSFLLPLRVDSLDETYRLGITGKTHRSRDISDEAVCRVSFHMLDNVFVGVLVAVQFLPNAFSILRALYNDNRAIVVSQVSTKQIDSAILISRDIHAVDFVTVYYHNCTSKIFFIAD